MDAFCVGNLGLRFLKKRKRGLILILYTSISLYSFNFITNQRSGREHLQDEIDVIKCQNLHGNNQCCQLTYNVFSLLAQSKLVTLIKNTCSKTSDGRNPQYTIEMAALGPWKIHVIMGAPPSNYRFDVASKIRFPTTSGFLAQ